MIGWIRRLRARIRYRHFDRDLAEELDLHREMKEHELRSSGVALDEPRWRAGRELGNLLLTREDARAEWIAPWAESVWQDVRYALRALRRNPGFAITASITLVFGIGLNLALFTVFNAIALRPWPVRSPGTLVQVFPQPDVQGRSSVISPAEYEFLSGGTTSFTGLSAFITSGANLDAEGPMLPAAFVTTNIFEVLGVGLQQGRGFISSDGSLREGRPVAVISDRLWLSRFQRDPGIVGRTIRIDSQAFVIIGVADASFTGLHNRLFTDVYLPLGCFEWLRPAEKLEAVNVVGRLARGRSRASARIELELLATRHRSSLFLSARPFLVIGTASIEQPTAVGGLRSLTLTLVAVFLVLLVACSNVGNLQLARGLGRRREIGIRLAIGASRMRVVRQLVTESVVLSFAAGGVALGVAYAVPGPIMRLLGGPADTVQALQPDGVVLVFAAVVSLMAALVTGLAPALQVTRPGLVIAARNVPGIGRSRIPVRTVLLSTQIALCMVLLVGAGLLTRAVSSALNANLDFHTHDVVVAQMTPGAQSDRADADGIVRSIAEGLESAGASPVGVVDVAPVRYNSIRMMIRLPGEPDALYRPVVPRSVSGGYFQVLGIPIVAGRSFDERSAERREVVVNEALARSVWPDSKAVGATFVDSRKGESYTVIGVARDSHDTGLGDVPPVLYTAGMPNRSSNLLVRGSLEVTAARIQTIAAGIAPDIKMTVVPLRNQIQKELRIPMLGAAVAWGIGLLGLALALVGVFGVFAYVVEERRREIGVRLALGARAPEVVRLILAQTRIATLGGIAAGFVLSLGAGQLLRNYLFGVSRVDPIAYGGIATALALSAFLAAYLPARRAARIDPAVTLRCD